MTDPTQKSCSDGKQVEAAMMAKKLARQSAKAIDDKDVIRVLVKSEEKEPEKQPQDGNSKEVS